MPTTAQLPSYQIAALLLLVPLYILSPLSGGQQYVCIPVVVLLRVLYVVAQQVQHRMSKRVPLR